MKLAITWLLACVLAAGCSIQHRSESFACETTTDCEGGRVCSGGFCVLTTLPVDGPTSTVDGPPGDIDAPPADECPAQCSSCSLDQQQCTIDCQTADCVAEVVCPVGWNCDIRCNQEGTCRNGINCLQAKSCKVECTGPGACRSVQCGLGACDVDCIGAESCRAVQCGQSCACDVDCREGSSCQSVVCSAPQCGTFDGGCSSEALGCNTCP